ncbi:hypothetical protein FGADI_12628 [Fusarium gaditjirri]|uniref:Uncharacterized protein n=1 Tax=Fusarium gaditjirri TaxID=282569 RepID=A0A8H4WNW7_9HYPO|nr:hypothetical protein FGADI_12628 [Fusarium gaditjirri]
MSIYRGGQRPKVKAFLGQWHNVPNDEATPRAMAACVEGARALTFIMQDFRAQIELRTTIDLETARDASGLITLVSFFLFGPLNGMLMVMEDKAKIRENNESVSSHRNDMRQLLQSVSEAQRGLNNLQTTQKLKVVERIQGIYESKRRSFTVPIMITSLSPIELLRRIVTARQAWDSLGDLCEEYRSLNIANSPGLNNTLAKAVFICKGISTDNVPTYTITASADHWAGYKRLSKYVKKLRDSRREAAKGDVPYGRGQDAKDIVEWSENLWKRRLFSSA